MVDDEADVRAMVDTLQDLGCQVMEAADGSAGLRIIQTGTPVDLLVTDVGLPGLERSSNFANTHGRKSLICPWS